MPGAPSSVLCSNKKTHGTAVSKMKKDARPNSLQKVKRPCWKHASGIANAMSINIWVESCEQGGGQQGLEWKRRFRNFHVFFFLKWPGFVPPVACWGDLFKSRLAKSQTMPIHEKARTPQIARPLLSWHHKHIYIYITTCLSTFLCPGRQRQTLPACNQGVRRQSFLTESL